MVSEGREDSKMAAKCESSCLRILMPLAERSKESRFG